MLSQHDKYGIERPLACGGRALHDCEKRYSVTCLEGLALVEAVREYHAFLANQHFDVYTDHISLKWLKEIKQHNGRLFRWSLILQHLDFDIHFKAGKKNNNADALSRLPFPEMPDEDLQDDLYDDVMTISNQPISSSGYREVRFEYDDPPNGLIPSIFR